MPRGGLGIKSDSMAATGRALLPFASRGHLVPGFIAFSRLRGQLAVNEKRGPEEGPLNGDKILLGLSNGVTCLLP